MGVREDLIAAKALIATEDLWWKGDDYSYCRGSECAVTACQSIAGAFHGPRVFAMTRALDAALPETWMGHRSAIDFNDSPYTHHADVLALFDRAIEASQ